MIWKDGGVLRTFLFGVVCAFAGIVELLQFTLLDTLGALGLLVATALIWRFMLYEVAQHFETEEWLDS